MSKLGHVQKKILLSLVGGLALGLSSSPRVYFRNLNEIRKEWKKIDRRSIDRSIKRLSEERLVEKEKMSNGSTRLTLTKEGKKIASSLKLAVGCGEVKKSKKWDSRWRVVIFDIPEKDRVFRGILREHLRSFGFLRLQNSVFISPHPFEKLILDLVRIYSANEYVRVIIADFVDNEKKLRKHFFKSGNRT